MKIKRVIIEDFRGYNGRTSVDLNNLTVFAGKNDSGKSTILEAIDIFFYEGSPTKGVIKIDKDDINKSTSNDFFSIGLVFSDYPNKIDLDGGATTTLNSEFLLNEDGDLEIWKKFKNHKCSDVYIKCKYHTDNKILKELITYKRPKLQEIVDKEKIECSNKNVNKILRESIREHYKPRVFELINISISKSDEDLKEIEAKINLHFPIYHLFQTDRNNNDDDSEIKDPLTEAVKDVLAEEEIYEELDRISTHVIKNVESLFSEAQQELAKIDEGIASQIKPKLPSAGELKWDGVFNKSIRTLTDNGVPLNKRGSGTRRLVLLGFLIARANSKSKSGKDIIYAIEEPENSLHPNYQKLLVNTLKNLAQKKQVIITTHSPSLIQFIEGRDIRKVDVAVHQRTIKSGDIAISDIVNDLGALPLLTKLVICVEGERDIEFWNGINDIPELKNISDISKYSIIPLQGEVLKKWAERHYLRGSNILEFHIYDKDDSNHYQQQIDLINNRGDGSVAQSTNSREIENYIPIPLIENEFNITFSNSEKQGWQNKDIPNLISQKIGNSMNINTIKKRICSLASSTNKQMLENHGVFDEIKSWFEKIKSIDRIS